MHVDLNGTNGNVHRVEGPAVCDSMFQQRGGVKDQSLVNILKHHFTRIF